ncbi:hypothetical protein PCE1_002507 [Barthelona sp. PCE]
MSQLSHFPISAVKRVVKRTLDDSITISKEANFLLTDLANEFFLTLGAASVNTSSESKSSMLNGSHVFSAITELGFGHLSEDVRTRLSDVTKQKRKITKSKKLAEQPMTQEDMDAFEQRRQELDRMMFEYS